MEFGFLIVVLEMENQAISFSLMLFLMLFSFHLFPGNHFVALRLVNKMRV